MLSKEEIQESKEIKETLEFANISIKELLHYKYRAKRLETDKQNLIDDLEDKMNKAEKDYKVILNSIDRKISKMKDEHKIRATYAEFGVKRGRLEVLQEILGILKGE